MNLAILTIILISLNSVNCQDKDEDYDLDDYQLDGDIDKDSDQSDLDYYDTVEPPGEQIQSKNVTNVDSVLDEAIQGANNKSTESKFLPNLTLEQLEDITDDMLTDYALKPEVYRSLPKTKLEVFKELLNRLPSKLVASIASKPGILMATPDEHIVAFSKNLNAVRLTDDAKIANMINSRPQIISQLPWQAVNIFMNNVGFISSLKRNTIKYLLQSHSFARKLEEIPKETLAKIVTKHPAILANLPPRYPAWSLTQKLVNDKSFLSMIPVEIHAYLAETNFRHQILPKVVKKILQIYPELPIHLSSRGLDLNRHYIRNHRFLNSLTCSVFLTLANSAVFLDRLDRKDVQILAENEHLWKCLPVSIVRKMMKVTNLGSRLKIEDVLTAAVAMSKAKSLDRHVVLNLLQYQFAGIAKNEWPVASAKKSYKKSLFSDLF